MEFDEKVKQARARLNLSQVAFAKELGISYTTLNRWENGRFKPNYEGQKRFEEYCKKRNIYSQQT